MTPSQRMIELAGAVRTPYELGAPISLADVLALPPDGNRYGRDERGRLTVIPPDDAEHHRIPEARLSRRLAAMLDEAKYDVLVEPSVAFPRTFALDGSLLPASHHGPKAIMPDIAVFARPLRYVKAPSGHTWLSTEGLGLVVEVLSPSTWKSDLGDGSTPEEVDRWRTYLENGVAEYWVLNAGFERCGLPPRSGLFLSFDRRTATWSDLVVERAIWAPADYRGRRVATGGTVRSIVLPEIFLDLEKFWRDCAQA